MTILEVLLEYSRRKKGDLEEWSAERKKKNFLDPIEEKKDDQHEGSRSRSSGSGKVHQEGPQTIKNKSN